MDVTITIITPLIVVLCAKYVYHVLLHCVSHCVVFIFCCNPAWIHIKCDCIHQHLPGSVVVWLSMFNLLKCTLAFFFPDIENLKTGFERTSCLSIRLPLTQAYSYHPVLLMAWLYSYWTVVAVCWGFFLTSLC